jgi:hypothetical protein
MCQLHGVQADPATGSDNYDSLSQAEPCPFQKGVVGGDKGTRGDGGFVERDTFRNPDEGSFRDKHVLAVSPDRAKTVTE